jgi:nitrite reductase/ring-hydroxylating ferredoxin subunit
MKAKSTFGFSRRQFVKAFALATAYSQFGPVTWSGTILADVRAVGVSDVGVFRMNLNDYVLLQKDYGSLRLKVTGMSGAFPEIIVTRIPGPGFYAVTSKCTHMGCTVNAYSTALNVLMCPCHGSQFKPDGSVVRAPASKPLAAYTTHFDGTSQLAIEIPGLGFSVQGSVVQTGPSTPTRLALTFPTVTGVKYGIQLRPELGGGSWSALPFSATPDGQAATTVLAGNGTPATVYVDPATATGFYAVIRY